ncbi:MAG: hypothetical protein E7637_02930 [Ruminococcaceae bacterium]|nr:hypothetical protein [Oscillospiraceae bacterium]
MKPIREIHLDFHNQPGIEDFLKDWDAEVFAERLARSHVRYINAFAKCNLGFCYYDTAIGTKYPGLPCDMMGELITACHKRGIGVTAYFNTGLDHEACRTHREWSKVNRNGQVLTEERVKSHIFRMPCYETGYGDYQYALIDEFLTKYPEVDGVFLDMLNVAPCYGNECLEAIRAEGGDPLDDEAVARHSYESTMRFCERVKKRVGDRNLICNSQPYWRMKEFSSHIEVECLPSGRWGYDFFAPNAAYARTINDHTLYMTGRFQNNWGDFGGLKPLASMENDLWDALSNGMGYSVGDHMPPTGRLDDRVYDNVEKVFAQCMAMEPWTDGARYVADIGVVVPLTSSTYFRDGEREYTGIARMLGELHVGFDFVNETMELSRYKLLILPDRMRMSSALQKKVTEFLQKGGSVLSAGLGGLDEQAMRFALPEWRFDVIGEKRAATSYYRLSDDAFSYAMYSASGIEMQAPDADCVYAYAVDAHFERKWDGFHGHYYLPPKTESVGTAAARSGRVCHISFGIFEAYYEAAYAAHRELVKACIDDLLCEPSLLCTGIPTTARATLTANGKHTLLHVKATYPERRGLAPVIESHCYLPGGCEASVLGEYRTAYLIPSRESVDFRIEAGRTVVTLPEIKGYVCVALER